MADLTQVNCTLTPILSGKIPHKQTHVEHYELTKNYTRDL